MSIIHSRIFRCGNASRVANHCCNAMKVQHPKMCGCRHGENMSYSWAWLSAAHILSFPKTCFLFTLNIFSCNICNICIKYNKASTIKKGFCKYVSSQFVYLFIWIWILPFLHEGSVRDTNIQFIFCVILQNGAKGCRGCRPVMPYLLFGR